MDGQSVGHTKYAALATKSLSGVVQMKNNMLDFFNNDEEFEHLLSWARKQKVLQAIQASVIKASSTSQPPLEIIEGQCKNTAKSLKESSVVLCVYGNVNVGKSTFSNLLLGQQLLHVTNVQCTAVPTTVSSSQHGETSGFVHFAENVNIENILDFAEENQSTLGDVTAWQKCKNMLLHLNSIRTETSSDTVKLENLREDLPIVSSLYPNLRKETIFSRIDIKAPVLGVTDPGLCLMDCPGTLENDLLTHIAKSGVQISSIIFYVLDSFAELSEKETRFLSCQVKNGSFVFFIFNCKDNDSPDILEIRLAQIKDAVSKYPELKDSPIFALNLKKAVDFVTATGEISAARKLFAFEDEEKLDDLLSSVLNVIQLKIRGMIFHFARSYFLLLHTHFLLLSKVISHKMKLTIPQKKTSSFHSSFLFKNEAASDIEQKMEDLSKQINNLLVKADQKIEHYRKELVKFYLNLIKDMELELQTIARKHKTKIPYEDNDKSWIKNVLDNLTSKKMSPFESELYRVIITHFASRFSVEFADWITSVRLKFSQEIVQEANGIQESVNSLRNEVTKADISVEMDSLLKQTEKHIGNMVAAQLSIAGPVVGLLATGVGVGVGTPLFLIGAVTGTIMTSGMVLLAGVAAAGILGGIFSFGYVQTINSKKEEDVRESVFESAIRHLRRWPDSGNPHYVNFSTKALSSCIQVKELVQSTLMLSVVQVETLLSKFDVASIQYEDLCNFLYMRETMENKIKSLCDLMAQFDRKEKLDLPSLFTQVQKTVTTKYIKNRGTLSSSTDAMIGCHYPQCYICKQEFIHCTHVCAECRVTINRMGNYPCPTCNKGNHVLSFDSPQLKHFETTFNQVDIEEMESISSVSGDWLPLYANEKSRITSILQNSNRIKSFVVWFNETFDNAHSSELITARNILNCFVSSFIRKTSPKNDVPELYRQILNESLQEIIYPQIYDCLFNIYKLHFQKTDTKIVEVMEDLADEDPSYYQQEIEWDKSAIEKFSHAIDCIRNFDRELVPLLKLRSLVACYKEFEKSIPENFSVGADLLVPTLVYFLVQSKVPHLCALFALVLDALTHTELMKPDEEYLFVTIHSLVLEFPKICIRYANDSDGAVKKGDSPLRIQPGQQ